MISGVARATLGHSLNTPLTPLSRFTSKPVHDENMVCVYLCVECHRGPLGVLRHLVAVVEVVAQARLLVLIHQIWVSAVCSDGDRQQTMHDDVRVSGGRRGAEKR